MKSLASVALSLLLLASVSFSSASAQNTPPAATDTPAAAGDGTEIPPIEEQSEADVSIDDIIAGATDNSAEGDAAKADGEVEKAAEKPKEIKDDAAKSDTAAVSEETGSLLEEEKPVAVEEKAATDEPVVVDEAAPAPEGLETAEEAAAVKKAEAEDAAAAQKVAEAEKETEAQAVQAEEAAVDAEADLQLFNDIEGMEFSEQMPAETKELQLPDEAAVAEDGSVAGCILPAGEPVEVTVPEVCNYVDIHDRRLKYKKTAAKLTASLEARRVSFEKPHFEALQNYRKNLEDTYLEDSKEYQQIVAKKNEKAATVMPVKKEEVKPEDKGDANADVPEGLEEEKSPAENGAVPEEEKRPVRVISGERDKKGAAEEEITKQPEPAKAAPILPEEVGVKEEELAPEVDAEGKPVRGKKVVMPADAPVFDPAHIQ